MSNKNRYDYEIELCKKSDKNSEYRFLIVSEKLIKNNTLIYKRINNEFEFNNGEVSENTKTISKSILKNSLLLSSYGSKELPDLIGNCTKLEWLDISQNELTALPESFKNLSNLKYLKCSHNQLRKLPEFISELQNLEYLEGFFNPWEEIPPTIQKLKANGCEIYL